MKPNSRRALACALTLALVICLPFASAGQASATPGEFSGADFTNGNFAFLKLDPTRRGTSPDFELELSEFNGAPAVKIAAVGSKMPYIGISASLLSDEDMAKADTVVLKLGVKSLDERFWPVTGVIYSYTGADLAENTGKFGVQTLESNPKLVYAKLKDKLVPGAGNYIMVQPSQDDGTAYKGKSDLYILGIGFRDADGNYLPVNADAGAVFPAGFGEIAEEIVTEEIVLVSGPIGEGWNNFNSSGDITLDVWQRAVALKVEYTSAENGSSPIDTNADGSKFVVQVVGGPSEQGWREIPLSDPLVAKVEGKSLTLALEDFDQVTEVQNVGIGCWDGMETVTSIKLVVKQGPEVYELPTDALTDGWNSFNSSGDITLDVWQRAQALVVEYAPREDGTSPIATNPDAGKFVVQVIGGPAEQGWHEIPLSDLLVEKEEGKLTLTLEDMGKVTEVQNVGLGIWDGTDTVTAMYLLLKPASTQKVELGLAPYKADWNNFNSTDGETPLEVWQKAIALVVEFSPRADGASPLETNPGGGKFVIQVMGGPAEQGWREVTLDDPLVELQPGKSLILSLEDFSQVTEVQNVGIGCWDGADTITQILLITK